MDDFWTKLLGLPQGSPGIKEALGILNDERIRKQHKRLIDDYEIPHIQTKYGGGNSWKQLQEWYEQARNEAPTMEMQEPIPMAETQEPLIPQDVWESQPALKGKLGGQEQVLGTTSGDYSKITEHALNYPGSRFTPEILEMFKQKMDPDTMARVIAASVSETGMGKAASTFRGDGGLKERNWWGFKLPTPDQPDWSRDWYDPPTWDIMIEDLLRNFGEGGRYSKITPESVNLYTTGDREDDWMNNFIATMQAMGY